MKLWILLDNQYTVDVWKGVVSPSRYSKHFVTCKTQGNTGSLWNATWLSRYWQGADTDEWLHKENPGVTATKHGWWICHPAANHLFIISKDAEILEPSEAEIINHYVASYFSSVSMQDLIFRWPLYFWEPEWKHLTKMTAKNYSMRWDTQELTLTLESDDSPQPSWWVDDSFATHHDMKCHTGGLMSLGNGTVYGTSRQQKIIACSSTEAELVGLNDVLSQITWTRYFWKHKGISLRVPQYIKKIWAP